MDDWMHRELARQDARVQRLKRPLIDAVLSAVAGDQDEFGGGSEERGISPRWTLLAALPLFRLLAADHRELWELLDVPERCAARLCQKPISCWNEQQACKRLWFWLEWGIHHELDDAACEGASNWRFQVREDLASHMTHHVSPRAALASERPRRSVPVDASSSLSSTFGTLGNDARVFVTAMEYRRRPTRTTAPHAAHCSAPPAGAEDDDSADELIAVSAEGCLWCRSPLAPLSAVLEIPRAHLFTITTLRGGKCVLLDAMEQCPALHSIREQEETILVLCLVFERFFRKQDSWWWRPLLERCPLVYPTVPTFWSLEELSELEGSNLIDQVLEKKDALTRFHGEVTELIEQFAKDVVRKRIQATISDEAAERFATTWQSIFSLDHLHWARATCDSRAFHLNIDGVETLALVPVADMVNHSLHTDILVRKVLPDDGPFVALCGAGLTSCDVGRELWMSYGPLQNWELLLSYGFLLGEENENDKVTFPIQLEEEEGGIDRELCASGKSDDENGDDCARQLADLQRSYAARRRVLIDRHGLDIGADCWIGYEGVPCPALLAFLRLQLAEIDEFSSLEAHSVFEPVTVALEQRVVEVIRSTISAMYADYSTTVAEDEALLHGHGDGSGAATRQPETPRGTGDDEESATDDESVVTPLSPNGVLAVRLRVLTKRILERVLRWCDRPIRVNV